jgi:hypothetical protein
MTSAFWSMLNRMLLEGMATAFLSSAARRRASSLNFGQEEVECRVPVDRTVFQQQGQHLEQVRLAGAEEAGDPDAVGTVVVVVGIQKVIQALGDLVGEDVFAPTQVPRLASSSALMTPSMGRFADCSGHGGSE